MRRVRRAGCTAGRHTCVLRRMVGLSAVRPTLLACVAATTLTACGPEGVGSIHADPARTSSVMLTRDRRASMPAPTKVESPSSTPKPTSSRR
jgi:hypothetical protein